MADDQIMRAEQQQLPQANAAAPPDAAASAASAAAADGLSATDRDLQSPEVARLARLRQQLQAEAAAVAAASASGDPKPPSPHRLERAAAAAAAAESPAVTSATPWSWTDEHSVAQTAMQLFLDTLDRIRRKNQDLQPNNATKIADNSKVRVHVGSSAAKPFYFRVPGSGGAYYVTTLHHCNCLAYFNQVTVHKTHLMCKHQIAALLADALGRTEPIVVADVAIAQSLASMEPARQSYGRGGGRRGSGGGEGGGSGGGSGRGGGRMEDGGFFHHQ